jgi:hypothetical protein
VRAMRRGRAGVGLAAAALDSDSSPAGLRRGRGDDGWVPPISLSGRGESGAALAGRLGRKAMRAGRLRRLQRPAACWFGPVRKRAAARACDWVGLEGRVGSLGV